MNKIPNPTPAELEILAVLWKHGPATVRFVNEFLNQEKRVGYTTTLKLMQIMTEKQLLTRRRQKRTHQYSPAIAEEEIQQKMVDRLMKSAFHGSPGDLLLGILGNYRPGEKERRKIREYLDRFENNDDHGD